MEDNEVLIKALTKYITNDDDFIKLLSTSYGYDKVVLGHLINNVIDDLDTYLLFETDQAISWFKTNGYIFNMDAIYKECKSIIEYNKDKFMNIIIGK